MDRVTKIAGQIALETPRRQGKWSTKAQVRWKLIHELREALTEAGVDLEAARRDMERSLK